LSELGSLDKHPSSSSSSLKTLRRVESGTRAARLGSSLSEKREGYETTISRKMKNFLSNQTKFTFLRSHCQPQRPHISGMLREPRSIRSLGELDQQIPFEKLHLHADGVAHLAWAPPFVTWNRHSFRLRTTKLVRWKSSRDF
jgi:hypothetical protein